MRIVLSPHLRLWAILPIFRHFRTHTRHTANDVYATSLDPSRWLNACLNGMGEQNKQPPWRRWHDLTNREPSSKALWSALAEGKPVVGECDELSVWMTELACAWGMRNAGLYWPTWNVTWLIEALRLPTGIQRIPRKVRFLRPYYLFASPSAALT